jgi:hypothetical protein
MAELVQVFALLGAGVVFFLAGVGLYTVFSR